jgi:RNase adaptor protein for sRNA GlmZ degradation
MKLILIYGAPAAGKLTVANEIAAQTDFKVFHNHLTIDAIAPIFPFGSESFWRLVHQFRIETVAEAARAGVDLIYTFCYAKDSDDAHVRLVTKAVEENGGEIHFVLLRCERHELEKRLVNESRKRFGKLKDVGILSELLEKNDLFSTVPERESLIIENTNLSAKQAAKKIVEHFDLKIL